jgi:hypothetical protein
VTSTTPGFRYDLRAASGNATKAKNIVLSLSEYDQSNKRAVEKPTVAETIPLSAIHSQDYKIHVRRLGTCAERLGVRFRRKRRIETG